MGRKQVTARPPPYYYAGMRFYQTLALFAACLLPSPVRADDPAHPGPLVEDPSTLRCLSFRWLISGDDNRNARVTVSYRKAGEQTWREALPMLRISREVADQGGTPYTAGNLFAGSVLNLSEGTSYEVRLRMTDPDGGGEERIISARTRETPAGYRGDRILHVYPAAFSGPRESPASSLQDAAHQAQPGDVILIHAGTYEGNLPVYRDGTEQKPIVFRGAGDGEAVLHGPGDSGNVIDISGRSHLRFEGLTISHGRTGVKANGCKDLVVRRCKVEDIESGIVTFSTDAAGWYIADNEITGRVKNWYPRVESSDTGVNCPGSGHVICHNRIRRFWDDISTDNLGKPKPEWANAIHPPQTAIDIYGNDISEALDDGIEADYCLYNIRVFENRVMNVHTGISAQPNLGGPLYIFRNVVYNTTNTPLKLHNFSTGLSIYHNTLIGAGQAFSSFPPAWQNATVRNNLFLGSAPYGMETGSPDRRTTLDNNGYMRKPGSDLLIKWSADGGKNWMRYSTLSDFHKATGHEQHGKEIRYADFERANPPKEGETYQTSDIDLRLKSGAAPIDAGCRVPTINDRFSGAAPDMGAYELGEKSPEDGPRAKI